MLYNQTLEWYGDYWRNVRVYGVFVNQYGAKCGYYKDVLGQVHTVWHMWENEWSIDPLFRL